MLSFRVKRVSRRRKKKTVRIRTRGSIGKLCFRRDTESFWNYNKKKNKKYNRESKTARGRDAPLKVGTGRELKTEE